jgi:dihydrofolate reductase
MPPRIRASVFVGASLDGFIARPDGAIDFLPDDPEPHGFDEFFATVDALLMGRKTFETVLAFGGAWPYGAKPVFVLTSRPLPPAPVGAVLEQVTGTPDEVMAKLGQRGIKHVYVDGGQTVQSFLSAGLIDRLIVTRVPVILGAGISIFGALARDIHLQHVATRSFPSGLVQSEYAVLPPK